MARAEIRSLRFSRLESRRLVLALLISLFVHLGVWVGYEVGKKFGWWRHLPNWSRKVEQKKSTALLAKTDDEPPMIFVDVSQAEKEPPKKAKYYSNKNSQAANPDAQNDSNQPKLNGKQKDVPKTEDVPKLQKLRPSPPKESPPETKPAEEAHPPSPMNLGDLALNKAAEPKPEEQKTAQQQQRPRTLNAARAQQQLPGQQMQQDGGVRRQRVWSSLDAKETPFGDYDRAIVEAVTQHWYDLLDSHRFAQDRTGKVIVHFKLMADGSVAELEISENSVGQLLGYVCEESVQEAAPFGKWPDDMKRMISANFREISFTFYYY